MFRRRICEARNPSCRIQHRSSFPSSLIAIAPSLTHPLDAFAVYCRPHPPHGYMPAAARHHWRGRCAYRRCTVRPEPRPSGTHPQSFSRQRPGVQQPQDMLERADDLHRRRLQIGFVFLDVVFFFSHRRRYLHPAAPKKAGCTRRSFLPRQPALHGKKRRYDVHAAAYSATPLHSSRHRAARVRRRTP